MTIAGRQWANYSIDDFSFSFLSIDQHTTITIEIFVNHNGIDHFVGISHFISGKDNRAAAIQEAIGGAKATVTG